MMVHSLQTVNPFDIEPKGSDEGFVHHDLGKRKKKRINRKDRNGLYCEVWEVVAEPVCLYVVVLCI